jgi:hypothetical protein
MRLRFFPPVSRRKATEIAGLKCASPKGDFQIFGSKPSRKRINIYCLPKESCWFIYAPWNDGKDMLRSSRIILVSKESGKVLYDGEAGDEG